MSKQQSSKGRGRAGQSVVAWLIHSHGNRHQLCMSNLPSFLSAVRDSTPELGLSNGNQHQATYKTDLDKGTCHRNIYSMRLSVENIAADKGGD